MNADKNEKLERMTETVIGCAYTVQNVLGNGFLEKVYENALVHELRKQGLECKQQYGIEVQYDGVCVGEYFADILVGNEVVVELKAVKALAPEHTAQTLNYLKATGKRVALLLNFATPRVEKKRIVNNY